MNDNPYFRPLTKFYNDLLKVRWEFPFLPAFVSSFVMLLILVILGVLCLTIGIATQLSTAFLRLIEDARLQMKSASHVEKSGYGIAIGMYCLFFIPLWLIQLPFQLVGFLFARMGLYALIPIACLIAVPFVNWNFVGSYLAQLDVMPPRRVGAAGEAKPDPRSKTAQPQTEEMRRWTSSDGKFVTNAIFVSVSNENVNLRKDDGTEVTVKLSLLCEEDQLWVQQRVAQE